MLVSGDLSYADGWGFRWDTFGALAEALFSRVPVMSTGGNHEVGGSEQWVPYAARWPTPHAASHSSSALYWSVDVGPAHVIGLNSYDNFINGGDSLQREWLEPCLRRKNRRRFGCIYIYSHVSCGSLSLSPQNAADRPYLVVGGGTNGNERPSINGSHTRLDRTFVAQARPCRVLSATRDSAVARSRDARASPASTETEWYFGPLEGG